MLCYAPRWARTGEGFLRLQLRVFKRRGGLGELEHGTEDRGDSGEDVGWIWKRTESGMRTVMPAEHWSNTWGTSVVGLVFWWRMEYCALVVYE